MTEAQINWLPWGDEAFRRAEEEGKPILLSIGAVWCHWCHVMDRTSYSDPGIAETINSEYIPVRVDTDRRPDVNARYNMGGWPTTAFLTSDGEILTGGTYIPPERLKPILREISKYYRENRDKIRARLAEEEHELRAPRDRQGAELSDEIVQNVIHSIEQDYDRKFGGFGREPKFPHSDAIDLALLGHVRTGNPGLLELAANTLKRMAAGGIYDREMDGFFRYSTTRDWSLPHYEKMLEDNAKLLRNYLDAWQLTEDREFLATARGIIIYVESTLSDQDSGAFYGSQDADEEYYALKRDERVQREAPGVDRTIYTDWNALMSSSYLRASVLLDEPKMRDRAIKALKFIEGHCFVRGTGLYHYFAGDEPQVLGLLGDHACLGQAMLDAYSVTFDPGDLQRARELGEALIEEFWDAASGALLDTARGLQAIGALRRKVRPIAENSVAARFLLGLAQTTGDDRFRETAAEVLKTFSAAYPRYDIMAAGYALAVHHYLHPIKATVVGPLEHPRTRELLAACGKAYAPTLSIAYQNAPLDAEMADDTTYAVPQQPAVYLCIANTCLPPLTEARDVSDRLQDLLKGEVLGLPPGLPQGVRPLDQFLDRGGAAPPGT